MEGTLLARLARGGTLGQIRYVTPVRPASAAGLVRSVYRQVERDFGVLAPPIALHSPSPDLLAASWMMLREALLVGGPAGRPARETVAAAVSVANRCPYCVEVHTIALRGLVGAGVGGAVADDRLADVDDPRLRAIGEWARAGAVGPGPFPAEHAAELIAVGVTFQYLNRMANVFLVPSPIPATAPSPVREGVRSLAGRLLAPILRRSVEPGASIDLLPAVAVGSRGPGASGGGPLAEAFGRASEAVRVAGERSVPPAVRALVEERMSTWDGRPPGLGRSWVEEPLMALDSDQRAVGRLALLTAVASYQVGEPVIAAVRRIAPDDSTLIDIASWAALTAAKRLTGRAAD